MPIPPSATAKGPFPFENGSELGAFVHLEHVNMRVPNQALSTLFYVKALGLTRDPHRRVGLDNMWVNMGRCQFHLPTGKPEPLGGEVGLIHPDPSAVMQRLNDQPALLDEGCQPSWCRASNSALSVPDPWGRTIVLHRGAQPRLAYVRFWVAPHALAGIAKFYARMFYCPTITQSNAVHVAVGAGQQLIFEAREGAELNAFSNHIALYLTLHQRIHQRLGRFDLATPYVNDQCRIYQVVHPVTGQVLGQLEHELRSVYHPDFLRPLLNRLAGLDEA